MTEPRAMEIPPMLDLIQWIQEHGTAATAERIAKAEQQSSEQFKAASQLADGVVRLTAQRDALEQQLQAQRESSISEYNKLAIACNELTLENLRFKQQLAEQQKEMDTLQLTCNVLASRAALSKPTEAD